MKKEILIDGSMGEGGGQVLRSSLALSLVTGIPFRIKNIRAGRRKPGLRHQHLTAVHAAVHISSAAVTGDKTGSTELYFNPGRVRPGEYSFSVGTAGSTTLVLQSVLPALLTADRRSRLVIEGGTHNPFAPPFDFLEKSFLPCIMRMGPVFSCTLDRPGYYPAGGGRITISVEPSDRLLPVEINERGKPLHHIAHAVVCKLSPQIGKRELAVVRKRLHWDEDCLRLVEMHEADGPGNVLVAEMAFEHITEIATGFGERGVPAERVAERVVSEITEYLDAGVPVGKHLADQLLLPFAMSGSGSFRTLPPTTHTLTNIEVIKKFLDIDIRCRELDRNVWQIFIE